VTVVALFFTRLTVEHPLVTASTVLLSSVVFALADACLARCTYRCHIFVKYSIFSKENN
jgi:hypothetical protein